MRSLLPSRLYYGWVMVASAFAINAVSSTLNPVVFSFLIGPMSRDLGVPKSALAWSLTLRLLAAGCTGPVLGVLIDRHGARWLGVVSGAIAGAMLIAIASAHQLWIIYAMFAVSGMAGLGGPAGQLLTQVPLAKWFVAQRGRAMAIATIGMAIGTIVAVPITQWLVEAVGWRGTTVAYGCVVIGVVVPVSALFIRRAPEDMGLHPDGAEGPPPAYATQTPTRAMRLVTETDWTVRQAMRTPAMWLLLGALALAGVSVTGTLVYRVDFWRSTGMSPGLVGFGTVLDPLCVVFSAFAFGMVADRVPIRYLGFVGLLGLAASIVPMVFSSGQTITIILHGATWGVAAGAYITLNNLVWPNYYGRRFLGAIRGVVLPLSIAASGIGAPLYGYLLDSGLEPAHVWMIATGSLVLAACLVLAARPPRLGAASHAAAITRGAAV